MEVSFVVMNASATAKSQRLILFILDSAYVKYSSSDLFRFRVRDNRALDGILLDLAILCVPLTGAIVSGKAIALQLAASLPSPAAADRVVGVTASTFNFGCCRPDMITGAVEGIRVTFSSSRSSSSASSSSTSSPSTSSADLSRDCNRRSNSRNWLQKNTVDRPSAWADPLLVSLAEPGRGVVDRWSSADGVTLSRLLTRSSWRRRWAAWYSLLELELLGRITAKTARHNHREQGNRSARQKAYTGSRLRQVTVCSNDDFFLTYSTSTFLFLQCSRHLTVYTSQLNSDIKTVTDATSFRKRVKFPTFAL